MEDGMALELTGPQFTRLGAALRATLGLAQFDQMLKQRLGINREDIALGGDYTEIVFKVIDEANRAGWVYKLVDAARQERPNNPVFVEYALIVGVGPQGLPAPAELESVINRANSILDFQKFLSAAGEIEGRVCRVDIQAEGAGTGFLVQPDLVMTNYHVVESVIKEQNSLADLTCRFDYKVHADSNESTTVINNGVIVKVAKIVTFSPVDPVDLLGTGANPKPQNLDYAVLKLERELGNEPIGGAKFGDARGWIKASKDGYSFPVDSPLFIVQHAGTRTMGVALETKAIIGLNKNKTRVRYRTNTEKGSSGSPCFTQNWELVALHHSGDKRWTPNWNEGIPIHVIRAHLQQNGFDNVL